MVDTNLGLRLEVQRSAVDSSVQNRGQGISRQVPRMRNNFSPTSSFCFSAYVAGICNHVQLGSKQLWM